MVEYIRWFDYLLFIIYTPVIYFISLKSIRGANSSELRKYFNCFFFFKTFASFAYVHVYLYYFKYGDTFRFFRFGQYYKNLLFEVQNVNFFDWLFMNYESYLNFTRLTLNSSFYIADTSYFISRISGLLSLFTFNSFLINTLIFSWFSTIGLWYMFIALRKLYPSLNKEFAFATLFVPSVVFWGSGLMKDTVCIGAMGLMTYNICKVFFIKEKKSLLSIVLNLIVFSISIYIIAQAKIYQLLALLPGIFIWIFYSYRERIKNNFIRKVITPFLFISSILIAIVGLQIFSENLESYALENVVDTAIGLNYNLTKQDAGSSYDLGLLDPSLSGLIRKFPAAVNVSLFRPYLWEVSNPLMLLSAIESLILLFLTFKVITKVGVLKLPGKITNSGIVMYCFIFSLIFGFATGISSQNFGSLVRYKIPIMPMYLVGIFITYYNTTGTSFFKESMRKTNKHKDS